MDWNITKKDHFSTSVSYLLHDRTSGGITNQEQISYLPTIYDLKTYRNSTSDELYDYAELSLNYKRNFSKEGQELNIYLKPSNVTANGPYSQNQHYVNNDSAFTGANGNNRTKQYETYINADYTHPFTKDVLLNTGVKGTYTRISSNTDLSVLVPSTGIYTTDPTQANTFDYSRDIYAGYLSLSFPIHKDYNLKLGIRDEVTLFNKVHSTDSTIPNYNTIAPSAVISKNFTKNQSLKISYAYRIQRPNWWDLNPYINASDPLNLQQGNPGLIPEKVHNIDLSYFHSYTKGNSLMVMIYYRYSTQDMQGYIFYKPTLQVGDSVYKNVSINTDVNAGTQYVYGGNISGTIKAFDEKMEIRGNVQLFNKYIVSSIVAGVTNSSFNYRANINISYKFTKTLVAECYGNFRSAQTEIQGTFPSFSSYSIAIRKLFWDKNGSLAFTTNNPFTPYVDQPTNITGQNFILKSDRKLPYQSFGLAFTYKFGKLEFKDSKQGGDMGGGEEMN